MIHACVQMQSIFFPFLCPKTQEGHWMSPVQITCTLHNTCICEDFRLLTSNFFWIYRAKITEKSTSPNLRRDSTCRGRRDAETCSPGANTSGTGTKSLAGIVDKWVKVECGLGLVEQCDTPKGLQKLEESVISSSLILCEATRHSKDQKSPKKCLLWGRHGEEKKQLQRGKKFTQICLLYFPDRPKSLIFGEKGNKHF